MKKVTNLPNVEQERKQLRDTMDKTFEILNNLPGKEKIFEFTEFLCKKTLSSKEKEKVIRLVNIHRSTELLTESMIRNKKMTKEMGENMLVFKQTMFDMMLDLYSTYVMQLSKGLKIIIEKNIRMFQRVVETIIDNPKQKINYQSLLDDVSINFEMITMVGGYLNIDILEKLRDSDQDKKIKKEIKDKLETIYVLGDFSEMIQGRILDTIFPLTFIAETHLDIVYADPLIHLLTHYDFDDDYLAEQCEWILLALTKLYTKQMLKKTQIAIDKALKKKCRARYLGLFELFNFDEKREYKDWLIKVLKNNHCNCKDFLAGVVANLGIKEALPILKKLLQENTNPLLNREYVSAINIIEDKVFNNEVNDSCRTETRGDWKQYAQRFNISVEEYNEDMNEDEEIDNNKAKTLSLHSKENKLVKKKYHIKEITAKISDKDIEDQMVSIYQTIKKNGESLDIIISSLNMSYQKPVLPKYHEQIFKYVALSQMIVSQSDFTSEYGGEHIYFSGKEVERLITYGDKILAGFPADLIRVIKNNTTSYAFLIDMTENFQKEQKKKQSNQEETNILLESKENNFRYEFSWEAEEKFQELEDRFVSGDGTLQLAQDIKDLIKKYPDYIKSYDLITKFYDEVGDIKAIYIYLRKGYDKAIELITDDKGNRPKEISWLHHPNRDIVGVIIDYAMFLRSNDLNKEASLQIFRKLFHANLIDNPGIRWLILAIREGLYATDLNKMFAPDKVLMPGTRDGRKSSEWFEEVSLKYPNEMKEFEKGCYSKEELEEREKIRKGRNDICYDEYVDRDKKEDFGILNQKEEFIETFVRSVEKVGRNNPCPCGSGKKYKKCCGL